MPCEVVGVVGDVRNVPLGQHIEPAFYTTTRQFPFSEVFIAVRAPDSATAPRRCGRGSGRWRRQCRMATPRTWGNRFAERSAEPRLLWSVLLFFGGVAAPCAALGVYGLFSWAVAQRTRELAIRLTLGARPCTVGGLVVRHGLSLIVAGVAGGPVAVQLLGGLLSRVLYGVSARDVGATAAACVVLIAAALIATIPPAISAMRVNPVDGLRVE